MGFYADRVFPPIMNRVMNTKQKRLIRSRVCAALCGDVIEIGFGTGLNLPHLPPGVEVLRAVDPLEHGRVLAFERIALGTVWSLMPKRIGELLPLARVCAECGSYASPTARFCVWTWSPTAMSAVAKPITCP